MFNKSVFRLAQGSQYKDRTMGIKNAATPTGQCLGLAASHNFVATPYGSGGSLAILPLNFADFKRDDSPPVVSAHPGALADFKFSPWSPNVLATAGEEGTVKLWDIPSGGLTASLSEPRVKLDLSSPVRNFQFHPSAAGVLGVGVKDGACLLDLEKGAVVSNFGQSGAGKDILSVAWEPNGSRLACLGKNSALHLFDPRQAPKEQLETFATVDTKKPQHVFYVKDKLCLVAQNSSQKPYLAYYDTNNLSKACLSQDLLLSPGLVLPYYDEDTDLLYLATRGATVMNIFDLSEQKKGAGPAFTAATSLVLDNGLKGACLVPKSALDYNQNEIQRVLSLTASSVEQYGIKIVRKIAGFNEELYPNTADCTPALSADEYLGGRNASVAKVPFLKLVGKFGGEAPSVSAAKTSAPAAASSAPSEAAASPTSASETKEDTPKSAPARKMSSIVTAKRADINQKLKVSIFKHIDGVEPREVKETFYRLNPFLSAIYMSKGLKANSNFLLLPCKIGNGSTLLVLDPHSPNRGSDSPFVLKGHKNPISAFDLSTVNMNLAASGDQNGGICIWNIPTGGLKADGVPVREFQAKGKITVCQLSESVDSLLATACSSGEGHSVQIWDVHGGSEICCIDGFHSDSITDIQFDPYGHLIATACKDGKVRVLDVRAKSTVAVLSVKECLRDTHVLWVSRNLLLVFGTGKGSRRSLSMWDIDTQTCVHSHEHDMNSATYLPYYDRSIRILWTANNGGSSIDIWELSPQAPYIEHMRTHSSLSLISAFTFLPKQTGVNVKGVQIAKSFKLFEDKVVPIRWTVPRKRLTFFQDDLFPEIWDGKALCTGTEWAAGQLPNGGERNLVSLKPADMENLSSAPPEELTERELRYAAHVAKQDAPKTKGATGHDNADAVKGYFSELAKDMPKKNRFDASYDERARDVDDSEWD